MKRTKIKQDYEPAVAHIGRGGVRMALAGAFVALAAVLAGASPILAQNDDGEGAVVGATSGAALDRLFTVQRVQVDETAANARKARDTAFEKAERIAWETLLAKLTDPEDRAGLESLSREGRRSLLGGIEVVREQSSSRRYRATLNVRFEPRLVSAFLGEQGVPHVLSAGRPLLVLHGHERAGNTYLWQSDPVVEQARAAVDWRNRVRQYRFPEGDLADRMALGMAELVRMNDGPALDMARRYGQEAALILLTRRTAEGIAYRYRVTGTSLVGEGAVPIGPDGPATAMANAFETVLDRLDRRWRQRLMVDTGTGGTVTAIVTTDRVEDFAAIMQAIKGVSLVRGHRLAALSLPESRVMLDYTGRREQLLLALRHAGILVTDEDAGLRLRLAGAGAGNQAPEQSDE
ncbi:DUF2066 domain-containing protein [Yunchengibacter salinarum]|uniref:DUF2066 domain-containing protein n=1 Tax=Yunchengibacter salinarum TaxID=3133399 RepID=UPI0035B6546C